MRPKKLPVREADSFADPRRTPALPSGRDRRNYPVPASESKEKAGALFRRQQ